MIPYGNSRTRLSGIIKDIQQSRAKIEFPSCNHKQISVPWNFIHSDLKNIVGKKQDMEIETWFLRKNRIIPLTDFKVNRNKDKFDI